MSSSEIEALIEFEQDKQRDLFRLDEAIEAQRRASRKRTDELLDWAMRRKTPNPKFDDEWNLKEHT